MNINNGFLNFTKNINFCNEIRSLVYLKKKRDILEDTISESNVDNIDIRENINELNNIYYKIKEIRLYLAHVSVEYRKKMYNTDDIFEPKSVFYVEEI
tara:strand:- start:1279 stop:1572 length:294 start_codon:yes stop_codon:yes gene_type:complete